MSNLLPNEADLVRRAKRGEPAAYATIYEQYQPIIYTYIFYRVESAPLAEDLTAEVFVRMVEKIQTFTEQGRPILAWLYTIAGNLVVDHYRREGRVTWVQLQEDDGKEASKNKPDEIIEAYLDQDKLVRALQHLTKEQYQVILLKFVEQRTNAEVGTILGKSEGAIKSLQHRAIDTLRRIMRAEEQKYGNKAT
jgi:RNA polymerase sigma-70 factor (ECF subfamily)